MASNDSMSRRSFHELPLLTAATTKILLDQIKLGAKNTSVSLDLGLSEERVSLSVDTASISKLEVSKKQLEKVLQRETVVFAIDEDGPFPLEIRGDEYLKLVPAAVGLGAPTLELSGVKMHRTKGIDPFEDSRTKAEAAVSPGGFVLDTCGGLGYTATWAARFGAAKVVSCEINPDIIALRRYNPWSREYLAQPKIDIREGSIADVIGEFADCSFDSVIHDPPRFSLAGELYGEIFIDQMARVLKPRGRLVFYTGDPYRAGRGRNFLQGIEKRLRKAGFSGDWNSELQAFVMKRK